MTESRGHDRPENAGSAGTPFPGPVPSRREGDDRGGGGGTPTAGSAAHTALTWWEVGDALWLAAHRLGGRETAPPTEPPPTEAPPARAHEPAASEATSVHGEPPSPPPNGTVDDTQGTDTGLPAVAPPVGYPTEGTVARPPLLTGRQALVRAMRWFRREHEVTGARLDEEATADDYARRALAAPRAHRARHTPVLPELLPDREVRDSLTLLIDDSLSMVIQQPVVGEIVDLVGPLRVFRQVRTYRFDSDKALADDLTLHASTGPAPHPTRLLDGDGAELVLVLSDGVGDGWHTGAVDAWLALWATQAAVGVAQLLDRAQWPATGMRPWQVSLSAPGRPDAGLVPNSGYRVRPLTSGLPAPPLPEDAIAVPLLPIRPHDLERWARFVSGDHSADGHPTTALLVAREPASPLPDNGPTPPGDDRPVLAGSGHDAKASRELDPQERVEIFRVVASPAAFRLAVYLAAVPLNLSTIDLVRRRFAPWARPSDLTEVLCSGLIRRSEGTPAMSRDDRVTLDFHPGVRELLLAAGGRRAEIKALLEAVAGYYRDRIPWFGDLERLLLGEVPDTTSPPVDTTPATAPFVAALHPALRALPGPIRRAADEWAGVSSASAYTADDRETLKDRAVAPGDSPPAGPSQQFAPAGPQFRAPVDDGTTAGEGAPMDDHAPTREGPPTGERVPRPEQREPAPPAGPRTRPAVWGQVPPRNTTFVGRESLLRSLADRLSHGATAVLPQAVPQTLQGMGGVGKTQLAMEYAWRHRANYDLVWWVPSDTPAQIQQSMIELAPKLGLAAGGDPTATVRAVQESLRAGRPYETWLLVYDNAANPGDVRPFIPSGGPGDILITSRSSEWRTAGGPLLQVDTFDRAESTELLLRRGPESLTPEDADQIAEKLGDLPLAVEQTAVWLYETLMPPEEWLTLFEEKAHELLSNVAPSPDYPWSVGATMNMTLERLRESHPGALQLLQVCAFLAAQPIPRRMFTGARGIDAPPQLAALLADPAIKLSRALRTIDRYALARMDHRNATFQLHRLVQETLKLPLSVEEREDYRHCGHMLLANLDPGDPYSSQDWPRYVELLPHVWEAGQWDCPSEWARQLVISQMHFLMLWGRSAEGEALGTRALDAWTNNLGADHPQTLRASMRYAQILSRLGRFQEAYDRSTRVVETLTRLRGVDDEETLEARIDLAVDLRNLGQFHGAVDVSNEVLDVYKRGFGRDDPFTLNAAHIHALGLRLTGDFTQAMEIDRYNYERRTEMFGPEHALTQSSRYGYALGLMESGRYWESMAELDELHHVNNRLYPPETPLRLVTMLALSTVKRRTGRLREALELSREAHELYEEHLGPDHQSTVRAAACHAVSLRAVGDHDAALALSADSRDRYRDIFGAQHPLYAHVSLNHAVALRLTGRVDQARAVDEAAIAVHTGRLGENHPATLANAANLASDLISSGDARAALERDLDTHERAHASFGADHPLTLAVLRNTILDRRVVERVPLDEERADVVMRYRTIFGPDHPATHTAENDVRANLDLFMTGL